MDSLIKTNKLALLSIALALGLLMAAGCSGSADEQGARSTQVSSAEGSIIDSMQTRSDLDAIYDELANS